MTINSALPILFPARTGDLPIIVSVINGDVAAISADIDSTNLRFCKDNTGLFVAETFADIDKLFVRHIEFQINRVFG